MPCRQRNIGWIKETAGHGDTIAKHVAQEWGREPGVVRFLLTHHHTATAPGALLVMVSAPSAPSHGAKQQAAAHHTAPPPPSTRHRWLS